MPRQTRHETPVEVSKVEPVESFGPIDRAFERMFGPWMAALPFRHPMTTAKQWFNDALIPVDEFEQDGTHVVRAELAGIDPDKDVELTVSGGFLHIAAVRHEEHNVEEDHYVRKEMRYGSFERSLPLPEGVTETDVKATYRDGILEVRVPSGQPAETTKIPITKG